MRDSVKDRVMVISFLLVIIIMSIANIIKKDTKVSLTERRKLQQFPKFSITELLNGGFFEKFDKYTMDQFLYREMFRTLKTNIEMKVLRKQDSNNIYVYDKKLIEQIYPLNEKSVINISKKINEIKKEYLDETNNVYYAIVPDKNYFVKDSHLRLDYERLQDILEGDLEWAEYIDIFDCLDLSCYYATDSHWKQERLQGVVEKITDVMNINKKEKYEEKIIMEFQGVFSGQFPIEMGMDEIRILTNEVIENCVVYNYETEKTTKVYDMEKLNALDKYDIYLSGAVPLLRIDNPNGDKDKELVVFRDSYGSSLIPLLLEGYRNVMVIDTRYISSKILDEYVKFKDKDVLFIYSTSLINNSVSLK